MESICDKCLKPFEIKNQKKFFKDGTKGKVIVHFFSCSHCGKKYPFHAESDEINKLVKKQQNIRKKIPHTFDVAKLDELYKDMEENKSMIKEFQNEYSILFKLSDDTGS